MVIVRHLNIAKYVFVCLFALCRQYGRYTYIYSKNVIYDRKWCFGLHFSNISCLISNSNWSQHNFNCVDSDYFHVISIFIYYVDVDWALVLVPCNQFYNMCVCFQHALHAFYWKRSCECMRKCVCVCAYSYELQIFAVFRDELKSIINTTFIYLTHTRLRDRRANFPLFADDLWLVTICLFSIFQKQKFSINLSRRIHRGESEL